MCLISLLALLKHSQFSMDCIDECCFHSNLVVLAVSCERECKIFIELPHLLANALPAWFALLTENVDLLSYR